MVRSACSRGSRLITPILQTASSVQTRSPAMRTKWLNVPYDSGLIFSRHLDHPTEAFKNESPICHRRRSTRSTIRTSFRRIRGACARFPPGHRCKPVAAALIELVEHCCSLAKTLGDLISQEWGFRLAAPVRLNVVCFRLTDGGAP